jgi:hypothetical protein
MQYRRLTILLLLAVPVFPVATSSVRAQTPPAQESPQYVARLQNFCTMVAFLNLASGSVRLVAIIQPTSPTAAATLRAVQSVLDANPSKRLRAYVVWTRLSTGDTELRALSQANSIRDRRLVHFWDGDAHVAGAFRGVLGAGETPATDVVLLYDTDARLALEPPAPSMWMSANPDLTGTADATQLGANANTMVRRVEAKVTDATPPRP